MDDEITEEEAKAAYEEALRRIEAAEASGATKLDLGDLPLKELPPEIGRLRQLQRLRVENYYGKHLRSKLTSLPAEIGQLINLQWLDLDGNWLTSLPAEIGQLTNLRQLDLSANRLTSLPTEIIHLTNLQQLYLGNNQLTSVPVEIGQLAHLQYLNFGNNRLTSLPAEIGQLANLERLILNANELTTLPAEIGLLTSLEELYVAENLLQNLPSTIGHLENLEIITLSDNRLNSLPAEMGELPNLAYLDLHNNSDLPIPPEIVSLMEHPTSILDYWREQLTAAQPLNEAKMVFVGQGGVGKTSLVQRLVYDRHDVEEGQTRGINIETWRLPVANKQVRLNIWDFGGQEIMHATHQFFLTARTLYLLVLDARQGEQEGRLEYWLALIQSFAANSPVIVVMNKCDEHHLDLNRRGLQQKYPTMIKGFVSVSARSSMGMEALKQMIRDALAAIPHIDSPLPPSWYQVKERLAQMQGEHDYIPYSRYQELCQQAGVAEDTSQRTLIRFLHDLGGVLNFQDDDRVRDTSVLNPEWVTQGVYTLLNSEELREQGGVLERRRLPDLLDSQRYPLERQRLILSLMEKFELAFAFEGGERYLVPDLLPVEQPEFSWQEGDSLRFEYHYAVLPRSILHRFMVRLHPFIHDGIAWRTGVMLAYDGMKALVKADIEDKRIRIGIQGGGKRRRDFLSMLRFTFASLHQNITGTQPEEHVPIPEEPAVTVPYEFLLTLEDNGVDQTFVPGLKRPINVQALLGAIEDPARRWQPTPQELHELLRDRFDEAEFKGLCDQLEILYVELGGESTAAKMRDLVAYMERRGRINELIDTLQQERPRVFDGRKRN